MSFATQTTQHYTPVRNASSFSEISAHAINTLRVWRCRSRTRNALANLDDHLLRDIGMTRTQAQFETGNWFWES